MIALPILSLLIYWSYYFYCLKTIGEKSSMSATFYSYPIKFRLFIIGTSFPIIIYALDYSIPLFWAGIFIFAVGLAAGRKGKAIESINHGIAATGGIIIAYGVLIYYMLTDFNYIDLAALIAFLLSAVIILPIGKKPGVKHHTTWIENVALTYILLDEILKRLI
jgi:hypothetical protein